MGARARDTVGIRSGLRGPCTAPAPLAPFAVNQPIPGHRARRKDDDWRPRPLAQPREPTRGPWDSRRLRSAFQSTDCPAGSLSELSRTRWYSSRTLPTGTSFAARSPNSDKRDKTSDDDFLSSEGIVGINTSVRDRSFEGMKTGLRVDECGPGKHESNDVVPASRSHTKTC
jgi:hypothetical protein